MQRKSTFNHNLLLPRVEGSSSPHLPTGTSAPAPPVRVAEDGNGIWLYREREEWDAAS